MAKLCLCLLVSFLALLQLFFKEQASFSFMAAVMVCSDFGAQENKVRHCFHFSPSICHEVMGPDVMILVFLNRGSVYCTFYTWSGNQSLFYTVSVNVEKTIPSTAYTGILARELLTLAAEFHPLDKKGITMKMCHHLECQTLSIIPLNLEIILEKKRK